MIAAIYARKSTGQIGVADERKSVARQIELARAYAVAKGWSVDEACGFVDDRISGAGFANQPGFFRPMNALKPRAPFEVLVMSEESRLGREAIETAYALKQIVTAGVRVFFYLEDRERTLDSPIDNIMLWLTAFADELEREKARLFGGSTPFRVPSEQSGHQHQGNTEVRFQEPRQGGRQVDVVLERGRPQHAECAGIPDAAARCLNPTPPSHRSTAERQAPIARGRSRARSPGSRCVTASSLITVFVGRRFGRLVM